MFFALAKIIRVVTLSLWLLPAQSDADLAFRYKFATAVVAVTDDEHEQNLLTSIARYESNYIERISRCECHGKECDSGRAKGAWQVIPYATEDKTQYCVSLEDDARLALGRIRESEAACAYLPSNERLAAYARGRCDSKEGKRLSRIRWVK